MGTLYIWILWKYPIRIMEEGNGQHSRDSRRVYESLRWVNNQTFIPILTGFTPTISKLGHVGGSLETCLKVFSSVIDPVSGGGGRVSISKILYIRGVH
jgi:hypothetical protein